MATKSAAVFFCTCTNGSGGDRGAKGERRQPGEGEGDRRHRRWWDEGNGYGGRGEREASPTADRVVEIEREASERGLRVGGD